MQIRTEMGKVLDQFKQFDIVDDFSGHHYSRMEYFSDGEVSTRHNKEWVNYIRCLFNGL